MKALSVGLPGREKSSDQRALAFSSSRIGARIPIALRLEWRLRTVRSSAR